MTMRDNAETAKLCAERGELVMRLTESLERVLRHCKSMSQEPEGDAKKDFEEAASLLLTGRTMAGCGGDYPPLAFSELAALYRVMRVVTQVVISGKAISHHTRGWLIEDLDRAWSAFERINFVKESNSESASYCQQRHRETTGAVGAAESE